MPRSRDTSTRGSDKGGREVLIVLSPKDLNDLRIARGQLWSARRHYEAYQLFLVAIDEHLASGLSHFIHLADRILE